MNAYGSRPRPSGDSSIDLPRVVRCHMVRREREDARPRAGLVLESDPETGDQALEQWQRLGARPLEDPRDSHRAPAAADLWLGYRYETSGSVWARLWLGDREVDNAGEYELGPSAWFDCARSQGQLALLLTCARINPNRSQRDAVSPKLREQLERAGRSGLLLALRVAARLTLDPGQDSQRGAVE